MAKTKFKAKIKSKTKSKTISKPKIKTKSKAAAKPKVKPKAKLVVKKKTLPAAMKPQTPIKKVNLSQLISPLDDRVLVQIQAGEKVTAGGIIIPDTAQVTGNQQGVIVAVGRGHRDKKGRLRPLDLKIGDMILLPEHSGDTLQIMGEDLRILRESEILGVIN